MIKLFFPSHQDNVAQWRDGRHGHIRHPVVLVLPGRLWKVAPIWGKLSLTFISLKTFVEQNAWCKTNFSLLPVHPAGRPRQPAQQSGYWKLLSKELKSSFKYINSKLSRQHRFLRYLDCTVLFTLRPRPPLRNLVWHDFCVLTQQCYRLTSRQEGKDESSGALTSTEGKMNKWKLINNTKMQAQSSRGCVSIVFCRNESET